VDPVDPRRIGNGPAHGASSHGVGALTQANGARIGRVSTPGA
jgi:hypothetical protein